MQPLPRLEDGGGGCPGVVAGASKSRLVPGLWWRWWDRCAIYLPMLLMAGLALGSYWLVRNTPQLPAVESPRELKHEVDYFLKKFTVRSYDEGGRLQSEVQGLEARHFADTDILEIDQARLRNMNAKGDIVNASGNRAYSNGDGSEIQLTGNAVVIRQAQQEARTGAGLGDSPRLEFRGEFLHVFLNEERVSSHKPVVLTRGADQFSGDVFEYVHLEGVATLKGRVKGHLVPRASQKAPTRYD